jgi:hypothetical protein
MTSSKRPRACDHCHFIKIKCELGTTGGSGPCSRCNRLGKECIITPPKRQKDRVAELEAQVKALTKLLEAQKLKAANDAAGTLPDHAGTNGHTDHVNGDPIPQKKRKFSNDIHEDAVLEHDPKDPESLEVDAFVSGDTQRRLLDKYLNELLPKFPLCPITGDCEYEAMRKSRALLLQAIVYAASPGLVSTDTQEALGKIIMSLFATEAIADGVKSLELVLAMQIVVMYYRAPRNHTHISAFQLVETFTSMAEKLADDGPFRLPSSSKKITDEELSATDARRAWYVCQLFSEAMAIYIRRPCPYRWDNNLASGLYLLEYTYALPTDRLLYQYIRAEALCGTIASRSNYYTSTVHDVSDPETQLKMQSLQDQITDWKAQIPPGVWCKGLAFWDLFMTMYLHEPVLHTSTNKQSFSAPFIAEKLSVTDFPKPVVTQEHLTSIAALKTASHAIIDLYTALDLQTAMALPAAQFATRVLYALYILVKIHIASTANGNTFGAFINPETLQIDCCIDKIAVGARVIGEVDDSCRQYRILQAVSRTREWLTTFRSWSFQRHSESDAYSNDINIPAPDTQPMVAASADWNNYLADETVGFELDELFPELQPNGWFTEPFEASNLYRFF